MTKSIAKMIDHTLVYPTATEGDIRKLCKEAKDYGYDLIQEDFD